MQSTTQSHDKPPMPTPTVPLKPLSSFKLLSFDIYGTLINWEIGISSGLAQLLKRLPPTISSTTHPSAANLKALYHKHERALQTQHPTMLYSTLLAQAYLLTASDLGIDTSTDDGDLQDEATTFGNSVGTWPSFPDTITAMHRLSSLGYTLVALSNTSHSLFAGTLSGPLQSSTPLGPFSAAYLAESIGTYKPDLNNYKYMLEHVKAEFGVEPHEVLVVANSLVHDHMPARELGLSSVWIERGKSTMGGDAETLHREGRVGYGWRVETLEELVELVVREREERKEAQRGRGGGA